MMPYQTIGFLQNINAVEILLLLAVLVLGYGLSIACLVHCALNQKLDGTAKAAWILVLFLIPVLGPIAYLLVSRNLGEKSP